MISMTFHSMHSSARQGIYARALSTTFAVSEGSRVGRQVNSQNGFAATRQGKPRSRRARWLSHRTKPAQPPGLQTPGHFLFCPNFLFPRETSEVS